MICSWLFGPAKDEKESLNLDTSQQDAPVKAEAINAQNTAAAKVSRETTPEANLAETHEQNPTFTAT